MNLIFFYDTETSGLPLFSERSSDPRQPHIVQAAAVLVDEDTRKVVSSFDLTAKPSGWDIPDDVAEIHGITTEYAREVGVPESQIVTALFAFALIAPLRIGHNQSFDARIMRIALKRFKNDSDADLWKKMPAECTCNMATPIVKAPATAKMHAAGRHGSKRASLSEAYEFFTGMKLEDAHTAMADTLACMAVYWAIKDREPPEAAPPPETTPLGTDPAGPPASDDEGVGFL